MSVASAPVPSGASPIIRFPLFTFPSPVRVFRVFRGSETFRGRKEGRMSQRNENRPGYKKTKVGWIPEAWECVPLSDIAQINPSATKPNEHASFVTFLAMADISGQGRIMSKQERPYSSVVNGFTSFRDGDILVAKITPCFENGKGAHLAGLTNGIGYGSTEFHVLRACNADERFLFLHTQSLPFRARGEANMTGSAGQKRVPTDFIRRYPIPLPPLPEQERIAEVLGAWDRAIALTDRLIEAKQRLKKGLMQQLLTGRLRFPQFGKPASKHDELPKGWSEIRLGKCLSQIIGGGTPSKAHPEYWNGNIPWATVKDASRGNTYDTLDHISNVGIRESSASLIPAGTILICTRMAVGKTIRFNCAVAINQDLKALFPKDSLSSDYLLVLLKFHEPRISRLGSGSTVNGIRLEELRNLPILLPDLLEQRHIASCLSACDREIQLLNGRRDRLQKQKRGLMQKLLTGEVRVPVKGRKHNVS